MIGYAFSLAVETELSHWGINYEDEVCYYLILMRSYCPKILSDGGVPPYDGFLNGQYWIGSGADDSANGSIP